MSSAIGIDIGGSSVKAVRLDDGDSQQKTSTSDVYSNPDRDELLKAVHQCIRKLEVSTPDRVGLCLPGKMNMDRSAICTSVNLPVLNGWDFSDIFESVFEHSAERFKVVTDADAAGFDYAKTHPIDGRTAAVSIGTGVGLCVLDGSVIVGIGAKGIGHLGLMDVGRHGSEDRFDSSGVRNSLESYIGSVALSGFRVGGKLDLSGMSKDKPSLTALVHALRMVHAIYQPDRITLMGGVGIALSSHRELLYQLVSDGLTTLAATGWTLEFGNSSYHAAMGAAKLAAQDL
jgi:predicted NBD/HSP70 family sugar kinase